MPNSRKVGDNIGRWELFEHLGSGGNADVWLASDGTNEVALKVLKTKREISEQYARFRNEIEVLKRLSGDPGVLPILESSLPGNPTKANPAWLAMPQATPFREALGGADLRGRVEAITSVAEVLVRAAAQGIAHRDVKPENLYGYKDARLSVTLGSLMSSICRIFGLRATGLAHLVTPPTSSLAEPQTRTHFPSTSFSLEKPC
jgi:serine/threonine protein kinase